MMFATLDDLEGSVEIIAFERTIEECQEALAVDSIALVRGRVDHKDASKTTVVVQKAEVFAPTEAEVAKAKEQVRALAPVGPKRVHVSCDAARLPSTIIDELKALLVGHPGESEVVLELRMTAGPRRLKLGPDFKVAHTATLRAELEHLLGTGALAVAS